MDAITLAQTSAPSATQRSTHDLAPTPLGCIRGDRRRLHVSGVRRPARRHATVGGCDIWPGSTPSGCRASGSRGSDMRSMEQRNLTEERKLARHAPPKPKTVVAVDMRTPSSLIRISRRASDRGATPAGTEDPFLIPRHHVLHRAGFGRLRTRHAFRRLVYMQRANPPLVSGTILLRSA